MATLSTIAAAVHAEFDAIPLDWAGGSVTHKVGAKYLHTQVAPPYVVWVHDRVAHHHDTHDGGPLDRGDGTQGQPFLARRLRVSVHVWAKEEADVDAAETLVEGLLAACNRTLKGSIRYGGETWPKQANHQYAQRGEPVVLHLEIDHPIDEVRWAPATIGSVTTTHTLTEPS